MVVVRPPSIVHHVPSFKITGKWCRMTGKGTKINPMEKEINKIAEKKSECSMKKESGCVKYVHYC